MPLALQSADMFPLFGAIPGGIELLILLVVFLFMLAVPVAIGVGLFLLGRRSGGNSDETELLRDRINSLEEKVDAREEVAEVDGEERTAESNHER